MALGGSLLFWIVMASSRRLWMVLARPMDCSFEICFDLDAAGCFC